jgi:hypothetical protein
LVIRSILEKSAWVRTNHTNRKGQSEHNAHPTGFFMLSREQKERIQAKIQAIKAKVRVVRANPGPTFQEYS